MNKTITQPKNSTAEQLIMKDLLNTMITEQFFRLNEQTLKPIAEVPVEIQALYDEWQQGWIYTEEICFLVEDSIRQKHQWVQDSPVFVRNEGTWEQVDSPVELGRQVFRHTLSEEAYAHPGVGEFLKGLELSIQQLGLSLNAVSEQQPASSYEWYVKGEQIASLRDRPFHPLAKAKIGFSQTDYEKYMAEFQNETILYWAAISNASITKGCKNSEVDCLRLLDGAERAMIENELLQNGISTETHTVMPIHEWQLEKIILPNFKKELADQTIILLNTKAGRFFSTSSVRSLAPVEASPYMLKLPISLKSLGAARYLPVVKLLNGIKGESMFRQALACDETLAEKVFLCEEKNWWGYMPESMGLFDDHPRHLAAQVRIYPKEIIKEGFKTIPMAALGVEWDGQHFLTQLFGGHISQEEVVRFYTELAALFYDVVLRLFKVGVVPEIHGQNCCVVLNGTKPMALLFRDHDSVRLHQPYLTKHGIKDPEYHIRPGYSNSLYNETIEKLVYYIQSLGTQVNLAAIMESLSSVYAVSEKQLWNISRQKLHNALQATAILEADKETLYQELFEKKEWPVKLVIRPLLEADGVPGAMPSGKGRGHNPFWREEHVNS
ncbi:IucA/IucC family protein [Domibacillus iocasae]|uniref:IucA/IucC family siderophore biosynthesis protein n=1 Tax=Domibacillus iocasae TaxID=1714016 RepID=A0A1E7DNZ0_9BACI|nr:IucA/IucC family protein [Domibacillus iocasae]OES44773.1 hypothetical protein BA724_05720 [Domibacillus iocasae]